MGSDRDKGPGKIYRYEIARVDFFGGKMMGMSGSYKNVTLPVPVQCAYLKQS